MNNKAFPRYHKRVKKKILAPMNYLLHDKGWNVHFIEASHEKSVVPEILWLAYLNDKIGIYKTSQLINVIIKKADELFAKQIQINGYVSSFCRLNKEQSEILYQELHKGRIVDTLTENLYDLKVLFPSFPLSFLIKNNNFYQVGALKYLKKTVENLNNRISIDTTFVLCHLFYPLLEIGVITLSNDFDYMDPQELINNPESETSQRIAASLRNSTKTIDREIISFDKYNWQKEFWKQCLILDPCKIDSLVHE